MKITALILLTLLTFDYAKSQEVIVVSKKALDISEPSDICLAPDGQTFLVPGAKSYLYRCSAQGEVIETASYKGYDLEGVCTDGKHIFVSEENFQRIVVLDAAHLNPEYSISLPHGGGRNEGREACCYLSSSREFLYSTEKNPQFFSRLNASHQIIEEFRIKGISEVSALTEFQEKIYALSDEDATIYQIDINKKTILQKWRLNILNPEGVVFLAEGKCIVISDDEARWYELELK